MSLIGTKAPAWKAGAYKNGEKVTVSSDELKGKWYVLYWYPLDFTFVCPTELVAFNDHLAEFTQRGAAVIAVSVDSKFSHLAWNSTPRKEGGLGNVGYPIVSDLNKSITRSYGVLLEEAGIALRGLFLIDKAGIVRHSLINDLPLGRNVGEALRTLDALQHFEQNGEVCPADWTKGKEAMAASAEGVKKYLSKS